MDFARQHIPEMVYDRVQSENALAIFYAIAGQSLQNFRTLSTHKRQRQLETLFTATYQYLLDEWNAGEIGLPGLAGSSCHGEAPGGKSTQAGACAAASLGGDSSGTNIADHAN